METTDRSITDIIATFWDSLKHFESYRERKSKSKDGKRKHKVSKAGVDEKSGGDEMKLSRSLRQGAIDVQKSYEDNYRLLGEQYRVGDATAQSSLRRILRRLHTCLHNIISSLLRKDIQLDYRSLKSISDVSRQETLEAMSLLSHRMSVSALSLYELQGDDPQQKHKKPSKKSLASSKSSSNLSRVSRQQSKNAGTRRGEPEIWKVQLKSASTPKLAMVRPKARRSSSSKSSEVSTNSTITPLPSPPPAYSSPRTPLSPPLTPRTSPSPRKRRPTPPAVQTPLTPPASPPGTDTLPTMRRRQDKLTPSVYTYQTTSTHLGEIPEIKWSKPYDHDAMAKLNELHHGKPWPLPPDATPKPKKGLFRLFRKNNGGAGA